MFLLEYVLKTVWYYDVFGIQYSLETCIVQKTQVCIEKNLLKVKIFEKIEYLKKNKVLSCYDATNLNFFKKAKNAQK